MNDKDDPNFDDPIIDSLLDEVLGGETPPDLTDRILGAYRASEEQVPPAVDVGVRVAVSHRRKISLNRSARRREAWWASAAIVLAGACLFGAWAYHQEQSLREANLPPAVTQPSPTQAPPRQPKDASPEEPSDGQADTVVHPGWADPEIVRNQLREARRKSEAAPVTDDQEAIPAETVVAEVESPTFQRAISLGQRRPDAQVVRAINGMLTKNWRRARLTPTGSISDAEWFARATSVLVGREPTSEEYAAFEQSRDREQAMNRLLASDAFADHWAKQFADSLLTGATSQAFDRQQLEDYLASAIRQDKAFDELTFELITAQGIASDSGDSANPAVNFLLAFDTKDSAAASVPAADKICHVFLGQQSQCARCHDHPADSSLTQQAYWEFVAFLVQMKVEKSGDSHLLVDRDYAGVDGKSWNDADLYYEQPDKYGAVAYARFPGTKQNSITSGRVEDVNRREQLGYAVVSSEAFALASVNRLWRQLFSRGLALPADGFRVRESSSLHDLHQLLAQEFRNTQFQIKDALRWMLMSAAFDRKVRPKNHLLVAQSGSDAFSSFPMRDVILHDQVSRPLKIAATNLSQRDPMVALGNLGAIKGMSAKEAARERQRVNSRHRERLLSSQRGTLIDRLTEEGKFTDREAIEHLFYAFLGRAPLPAEREHSLTIVASGRRADGLIRVGEILLNSREFKARQ